jgi:hypothetical protein
MTTYWRREDEDRFDDRVSRTEAHWLWTGYVDPRDGYGRFKPRHNDPAQLAHRLAYARWVRPVPEDMVIDHLDHPFRLRRCVRPACLEAITHEENIRRGNSPAGHNARLVACPRCGDPLNDPAFATQRKDGSRRCLRCQRAEHARYRAKKRASEQGPSQAGASPAE